MFWLRNKKKILSTLLSEGLIDVKNIKQQTKLKTNINLDINKNNISQAIFHYKTSQPSISTVVYVISCRLFWLQYRFSKMADVRDSKS